MIDTQTIKKNLRAGDVVVLRNGVEALVRSLDRWPIIDATIIDHGSQPAVYTGFFGPTDIDKLRGRNGSIHDVGDAYILRIGTYQEDFG